MRNCPHCCAQLVDDPSAVCSYCGRSPSDGGDADASPGSKAPDSTSAAVNAVPNRQATKLANWKLASVGAVLGALLVALLIGRPASHSTASPPAIQQPVTRPAVSEPLPRDSSERPTWIGRRRPTWARDGSKTISFELQADNEVRLWMQRAVPVLVARCLFHRTEVFVVTGSTSIESNPDRHTVRLQFDKDPEQVQQWLDSSSSQELFAPDGVALAQRLERATRLRFGFTPYNASPVVADFNVAGFHELAKLVATTCGRRADDSGARAPRNAPKESLTSAPTSARAR